MPFSKATQTSMEFNSVMSEVISKTHEGAKYADQLKNKAIELGKATKFSAMEAGQGMTYLAMAGFDAEEQMQAMPGLLSLAAAGNTDLALSADIVSDTLTAMGLKAKDTGDIADIMALGANRANTSISLMGETFKYATATANQLGVSMSELTAMTGMLGDIGLKGSMAGTAINQMLLGLTQIGGSEKAQKALGKLGLTMSDLTDSNGNLKRVTDIIPLLANRLKGIEGNVTQTNIMQDIFGIRGAKGFAAFTKEGAKDFNAFVEELRNSSGSANRIAEEMLDNLAGDVTIFKSTLESTMITIGSKLEPILRPVVKMFTGLVDLVGRFIETPIGRFVMYLVVAFGALLLVGGALISVVAVLGMLSAQAAIGFGAMGMAEVSAAFATGGLTAGMSALGVAIWTALAPLLPFIAAIVGVIAVVGGAVVAAKKANNEFQKVLEDNTKAEKGFKGFVQRVGGVFEGIKHIWRSATEEGFTLSDKMHSALESLGILDFVVNLGTWIVRIKNFFRGIKETFTDAWDMVKMFAKQAWSYLKPLINNVFDKLGFSLDKATSKMEYWKKAGKAVGVALLIFLAPVFLTLLSIAITLTITIGSVVLAMYLIYKAAMFVWSGFKFMFKNIAIGFQLVWDIIKSFYQFFVDIWNGEGVKEAGSNLVNNLLNGIKGAWGKLKSNLIQLVSELPFGDKILGSLGVETDNELSNVTKTTDPEGGPIEKLKNATTENNNLRSEKTQPQFIDRTITKERLVNQTILLDGDRIAKKVTEKIQEEVTRG